MCQRGGFDPCPVHGASPQSSRGLLGVCCCSDSDTQASKAPNSSTTCTASPCVSVFKPCLRLIKCETAQRAPFPVRSGEADGAAWAALPGRKGLLVPPAPGPVASGLGSQEGTGGHTGTHRDLGEQGLGRLGLSWATLRSCSPSLPSLPLLPGSWACLGAGGRHSPCRVQGRAAPAGASSLPQWAAVTSAPQLPVQGVLGSCRSVELNCLIRGI